MGTAIKHPLPNWAELSFEIFDIRALWRSALSVRVPRCQKLQMTAQPGLAQDAYSCTHMAAVSVKGLTDNRTVWKSEQFIMWYTMIWVKAQTADDAASQDTYDVGAIDTLWKLHRHHRVGSSCVPELNNTTKHKKSYNLCWLVSRSSVNYQENRDNTQACRDTVIFDTAFRKKLTLTFSSVSPRMMFRFT